MLSDSLLVVSLFLSASIHISNGNNIFTSQLFDEFKSDLEEIFRCNTTFPLDQDNACQGLNQLHPDVSVYDIQGPREVAFIVEGVRGGLLRLAFHDCGEILPNFVALGLYDMTLLSCLL